MDMNYSAFNASEEKCVQPDDGYREMYETAKLVTGLVCYPIVCLFGLVGNILSVAVLSQRKMESSTTTFLVALAVSDMIKLGSDTIYFLVVLIGRVDAESGHHAYVYLYPYAHYLFNASVCTTAWLTVSVAVERYVLVCHATRARVMCSVQRARLASAAVFVSMALLTAPTMLRYHIVYRPRNMTTGCELYIDLQPSKLWSNPTFFHAYTWAQNCMRSLAPLLLICTFNFFIVRRVQRTRATKRLTSRGHRITAMLVAVCVVFMVCIAPDAILSTFFGCGYHDAPYRVRWVREITDLLLAVNSAVNVILYCTFNKIFRDRAAALFCARRWRYSWRMRRSDNQSRAMETHQRLSFLVTVRPTPSPVGAMETEEADL